MFGTPQDILAILAGAALIFGGGGAAVRSQFSRTHATPAESAASGADAETPADERPPSGAGRPL